MFKQTMCIHKKYATPKFKTKKELVIYVTTRMDLKDIVLCSDKSQYQKGTYYMIPFI